MECKKRIGLAGTLLLALCVALSLGVSTALAKGEATQGKRSKVEREKFLREKFDATLGLDSVSINSKGRAGNARKFKRERSSRGDLGAMRIEETTDGKDRATMLLLHADGYFFYSDSGGRRKFNAERKALHKKGKSPVEGKNSEPKLSVASNIVAVTIADGNATIGDVQCQDKDSDCIARGILAQLDETSAEEFAAMLLAFGDDLDPAQGGRNIQKVIQRMAEIRLGEVP